jgi:hypothetical protein
MITGWWLGASPADGLARAPGKPALGPNQAIVTVPGRVRTKAIPSEFLGISTEYSTLPLVEKHPDLWERVLFQVTQLGSVPVLPLRIGGDSAEHVIYGRRPPQFAPWEVFSPTAKLVNDTARAIGASKLQVIVDINTITSTPHAVGLWMKRLWNRLLYIHGGRIVAFELGNEPDIYSCAAWAGGLLKAVDHAASESQKCPARLPKRITAAGFAKNFQAYARALHQAVPDVPVMAPALAKPTGHLGWIRTLLGDRTKRLRVITAHVYPYSACVKDPSDPHYPTIQKVLSEDATAGMASTVVPAVRLAQARGRSLRLTEINSVTCGGKRGVSDTFATALWAPDALFELIDAGVEGVHLHARLRSINRPFSFTAGGLRTRPLLYGLIVFKRMLGPGARLVRIRLRSGRSLHLKVWAVRESYSPGYGEGTPAMRNPLKVLLINKGGRTARVTLHLPTRRRAFIQRLLAHSASSTSGVTLEGQRLNRQAEWQGVPNRQTLPSRSGSYVLWVRGYSAALLTVPVPAGTLNAKPQKAAGPTPTFGYE